MSNRLKTHSPKNFEVRLGTVSVRKSFLVGAVAALLVSYVPQISALPAQAADSNGKASAEASVVIKAPPRVVWHAIHAERTQNPDVAYSKIVHDTGNTKTIEQKFVNIPIWGSVTAVTKQIEETNKHIDYSLVSSDRFKALDGSWDLQPVNGGKETKLNLRSHLDVGIPFSSFFIKAATQKKLVRRVNNVKQIAEREQAHIAANGGEERLP